MKGLTHRARCSLALLLLAGCQHAAPVADAPARNVILFIGDGMGMTTITAARIFDGQSRGQTGEENELAFERFPNVALVKTYNTNQQVADSAGTATAMVTGVKTRAGVINVAPSAGRRDCAGSLASPLESLGEIAKSRGLAVGVVTTARLTHATPAVMYAHSPERDWESDRYMTPRDISLGCRDMARQLVEFQPGGGLDIALGGGYREFVGTSLGGERREQDANLVEHWLAAGENRRFVADAEGLAEIAPREQVLGLFARSHMTYIAERGDDSTEPTLESMTVAAIDHLAARDSGYFLMVEGGRIDHGHHDGKPGYALLETQAFARAVDAALERVDLEDTLVLVTADHSHTFSIAGYPTRGNPILGLVVGNDLSGEAREEPSLAADGKPYTTVGYINGPGAVAGERAVPGTEIGALAQALVPMAWQQIDGSISDAETHGGEDVPLYAIGNGAQRVAGVIEQNRIFDIINAALEWPE
jgi:alkaline phosphatase